MQKNKNNWTIKKIIFLFAVIFLIGKLIFDFSGFWNNLSSVFEYIGDLLSYLLTGFVIAYVLNAYIDFWDRKLLKNVLKKNAKTKKAICIVIAYLTLFGILSFLIFTLVPTLTNTINDLIKKIPSLIDEGITFYSNLLDGTKYEIPADVLKSIENAIDSLLDSLISLFDIRLLTNLLTNTTTWIFNFVMGLIVSVYMLIEKENTLIALNRILDALLTSKSANRIRWIGAEINDIFRNYFTDKLLQALIFAVLAYISFSIARIPYAILFAVILGITNMIPYIGPWVGAVPVVLVSLVYDFWLGVAAVICILICQSIDNWFISPKVVGGKMGISPLLVLAGLGIGGKLFGFIGLVFGDVLAAIFKLFFYDVYVSRKIEVKDRKRRIFSEESEEDGIKEASTTAEIAGESNVSQEENNASLKEASVSIKEKANKVVTRIKTVFKRK